MIHVLWHLLNVFVPAAAVALLSAAAVKLLWWKEYRPVSWTRLILIPLSLNALVLLGGLIWSGQDGKMATYAVMTLTNALGLWWSQR